MRKSSAVKSAIMALVGTISFAAYADAQQIDVPAGDLITALRALAKQADVDLVYQDDQLKGLITSGVSGDLSARDAVLKLLAGTPLQVRTDSASGAILITLPLQSSSTVEPAESAIEEVVVTAQKRSERAQDVPASISVLSGERLETLHATSLQDYAAYAPGLIVSSGGAPGKTQITLRGLNALSAGATMVATVLDDTPVGSSNGWAQESRLSFDMMPNDIERVEILRGPQGTLYGANSMGGLVKYVTRAPNLNDLETRIGGETYTIGPADGLGYAGRASFNLPIIAGELAIRASFYEQKTPGYIDNPLTGAKDENSLSQRGGRLALLWAPSENLSVKLQAIHQQIESDNNGVVIRNLGGQSPNTEVPDPNLPPAFRGLAPRDGDLTHGHPLNEPFEKQISYFSATVNWNLGVADFTSASSFAHTVTKQTVDATDFYGTLFGGRSQFRPDLDLKRFTQEFRLASPSGETLEWLIGSYYSHEDSENVQLVTALDTNNAPIAGLNPLVVDSIPTRYREIAAFANATYKFTEAFDVTAGVRWARNEQDFEEIVDGGAGLVFANSHTYGSSAESVATWAGSARYHIDDDVMLYARIATGYRPGGPNSTLDMAGVPSQVNSDTTRNYEAGIKSQFWDRRAMVDLTVFQVDWYDVQLTASSGGNTYGVNGGTARSRGVELAAACSPARGLQLGLTAAYTDATITEDVQSNVVHWTKGAHLPTAPKWSGSVTADYEYSWNADWSGRLGAGLRYVGEQFSDVQSATRASALPAYSVLDLNAGVFYGAWSVSLYVKNAMDKRAYTSQTVATNAFGDPLYLSSVVLQPRTIGISVDAKW